MAKTADVGSGQTIASAWGNEIRDRATQVFSTQAELTAWAAPNGSFAINLADRALWERIGTNWYRQKGVVVFGSIAERDSAWAAPPDGSVCITVDSNTQWQRISGNWVAMDAWAWAPFAQVTVGSADTPIPLIASIGTKNMTKLTASRIRFDNPGFYLIAIALTAYAPSANASGEWWIHCRVFDGSGANYYTMTNRQFLITSNNIWYHARTPTFTLNANKNDAIEIQTGIQTPNGLYIAPEPQSYLSVARLSNR